MIIKSMSRKNPSFGQLIEYLTNPKEMPEGIKDIPPPEVFNMLVSPDDLSAVLNEFEKNYDDHHSKRSNFVCMYHEVISPSNLDEAAVNSDMLYDLACKFSESRAPGSIGFFQVHPGIEGERSAHVHIMLSGNSFGSSAQSSLRKYEFRQVKEKLREYTLLKYPELEHAFQFDQNHDQDFNDKLQQRLRRKKKEKKLSDVEQLIAEQFEAVLRIAKDQDELEQLLEGEGLKFYKTEKRKRPGLQKH